MFRMNNLENGVLIDGDELLLAKIIGKDLSNVDISDLPINAQTLSQQYLIASSTPGPISIVQDEFENDVQVYEYHESQRYAVLKFAYLNMVKEAEEKAKEGL
jgi:hypothetical protein